MFFQHILYVVDFNRKLYLCLSKDLGESLYESEIDNTLFRVPYPTLLRSGYWVHNDFTSKGLYVKNADGGDYEVRKHAEQISPNLLGLRKNTISVYAKLCTYLIYSFSDSVNILYLLHSIISGLTN